jgi:F-type H+-transporting ATPase subunit b
VWVNFAVFATVLVLVLRKPLSGFFGARREEIARSLSAAERAQAAAQAKLVEADARLEALAGEVAEMLARAKVQAAAEREAILAAARAEAERIVLQAQAQATDIETDAVRRLKATAADLAVDVAREILVKQLKPEDGQRVFERYLKGLQKAAS